MEEAKLYRPILKRSWLITKKYKNLWFLGLFAAIMGTGGEYEIFYRSFSSPGQNRGVFFDTISSFKNGWQDGLALGGNLWQNIWLAITNDPISLIVSLLILAVSIAIVAFVVWLATSAQIGLVRNVTLAAKNKKSTINEAIDFGVKNFWPVFLINLVFKAAVMILFVFLGWIILFSANKGLGGIALYLLVFLAFVAFTFIASFIVRYQILYLLLKKKKFVEALRAGWELFLANWLISIEMALLMFVIYALAAFLTVLSGIIILDILLLLLTYYPAWLWLIGLSILLFFFVAVAAILLITAILNTFQWAAWILLFSQISAGEAISKIMRASVQIPQYFQKK